VGIVEYLLVAFRESRGVIVDGVLEGLTNEVLELEKGTHEIMLAPPADFTPEKHEIILRRTTAISPKVVSFE
jgi:hypothetical protein